MKNDGGPAFPYLTASETKSEVTTHEGERGMSLRDYFAARAMQAFCQGAKNMVDWEEWAVREQFATVAKFSFWMAEEMLKAREA
jgi:hypothetical protein